MGFSENERHFGFFSIHFGLLNITNSVNSLPHWHSCSLYLTALKPGWLKAFSQVKKPSLEKLNTSFHRLRHAEEPEKESRTVLYKSHNIPACSLAVAKCCGDIEGSQAFLKALIEAVWGRIQEIVKPHTIHTSSMMNLLDCSKAVGAGKISAIGFKLV